MGCESGLLRAASEGRRGRHYHRIVPIRQQQQQQRSAASCVSSPNHQESSSCSSTTSSYSFATFLSLDSSSQSSSSPFPSPSSPSDVDDEVKTMMIDHKRPKSSKTTDGKTAAKRTPRSEEAKPSAGNNCVQVPKEPMARNGSTKSISSTVEGRRRKQETTKLCWAFKVSSNLQTDDNQKLIIANETDQNRQFLGSFHHVPPKQCDSLPNTFRINDSEDSRIQQRSNLLPGSIHGGSTAGCSPLIQSSNSSSSSSSSPNKIPTKQDPHQQGVIELNHLGDTVDFHRSSNNIAVVNKPIIQLLIHSSSSSSVSKKYLISDNPIAVAGALRKRYCHGFQPLTKASIKRPRQADHNLDNHDDAGFNTPQNDHQIINCSLIKSDDRRKRPSLNFNKMRKMKICKF